MIEWLQWTQCNQVLQISAALTSAMMLLNCELKQTISSLSYFCQEIVLSPCQEKKLRLSHIPMFAFAIFLSWCPSKKSLQDHEPFPYTFFYQFTGSCLMFKSLVLSVSHLGPLWFIETLGLLFYFFLKNAVWLLIGIVWDQSIVFCVWIFS